MVRAGIEVDASNALKNLKRLEEQARKSTFEAAEESVEDGEDNARQQLHRQGSVASGTGVNSLDARRISKSRYGVVGVDYLIPLDTGTAPHTPEINTRLIIWASQEGWKVSEIVEHIEEEGTKPMPRNESWRKIAFDPVIKQLPGKVTKKLRRNVKMKRSRRIST